MNPTLEAAHEYQRRGLSIIPIQPKGKKPLIPWERYQTERADQVEIEKWFADPNVNIAIVTGAISGLVVSDLDTPAAKNQLKKIAVDYDLESVPRTRTGKGWQLFFDHPGILVPNRAGVIAGLDVRGDGGYVVAPPSIHPNGRRYQWEVPLSDDLPKLPSALFELITAPNSSGNGYCERFNTAEALKGVPHGQRDNVIWRLACKLRSADVPQDIACALMSEAAKNCQPPFPETIALEKVTRAYRKYPSRDQLQKNDDPSWIGEKPKAGHDFDLIDAKALLALNEPAVQWVWDGVLPTGGMSLNVAKPKVGKTTFALSLSVNVARGDPFLGRATTKGRVVYLALEEKRGEIQKKLQALRVSDEDIFFHFGSAPAKAIEKIGPLIESTGAKLVVIDVLQKFIRARDLNDYALVTSALEPILAAARKFDCHVMLTHHAGKAERKGGDEVLGSTALLGGVDTSIHLKRREKRRSFYTIQRYGEDIEETVIELDQDGAVLAVGSKAEVDIRETIPGVLEALKDGPLDRDDVLKRVERKRSVVLSALSKLGDDGKVERTGSGKKGDPFVYTIPYFCSPYTMGTAGTESESKPNSTADNDLFRSCDFQEKSSGQETPGTEFPGGWDEEL